MSIPGWHAIAAVLSGNRLALILTQTDVILRFPALEIWLKLWLGMLNERYLTQSARKQSLRGYLAISQSPNSLDHEPKRQLEMFKIEDPPGECK